LRTTDNWKSGLIITRCCARDESPGLDNIGC